MIWRIYERLLQARRLDRIGIATTTEPSDDSLAAFAEESKIPCYRGSVDDIIERLAGAAEVFAAEVVVRVWGDCPMVDPGLVDRVIEKLKEEDLDYASNYLPTERTFPVGMEVEAYRRPTLLLLKKEAADPFCREFPIEYLLKNPDKFRRGLISHEADLSRFQLSVDYPQDLELARAVYSELYRPESPFSYRDVLAFLEKRPGLIGKVSGLPRHVDYHQKKRREP